ncbi:hypothetical protein AHAS_Ahas12G0111800 [Arachis hypogaea]
MAPTYMKKLIGLVVIVYAYLRLQEEISEIEHQDETSRILSANDFLAQTLGKERSGGVHGIGFGMTPSQLFRPSS